MGELTHPRPYYGTIGNTYPVLGAGVASPIPPLFHAPAMVQGTVVVSTPRGDAVTHPVTIARLIPTSWEDTGEIELYAWLLPRPSHPANGILVSASALMRDMHPDMNDDAHVGGGHPAQNANAIRPTALSRHDR